MMSEEMKQYVLDLFNKKAAKDGLPSFELRSVEKSYGQTLTAIIITGQPAGKPVPALYFEPIEERLKMLGLTIPEMVDRMYRIYCEKMQVNFGFTQNKESILQNVRMEVRDIKSVKNFAEGKVCRKSEEMGLIAFYRVIIKNENDHCASYLFNQKQAEAIGLTEPELYKAACENVKARLSCTSVADKIGMPDETELYVISDQDNLWGSSVLLMPEVVADFAKEKLGTDVYVLPSSVHEVLMVAKNKWNLPYLQSMVTEINATLPVEDVLHNTVYEASIKDRSVKIAHEKPSIREQLKSEACKTTGLLKANKKTVQHYQER